ncbi:MAG: hypothetical protein JNM00_08455, partial [Flavobacteriales bacterium]|nr:hypothetical protein [Flavobacteriales bacterium]
MRRSIFLHLISTGLLFTSLHAVAQVPAVAPAAQPAPVYSIYQDPIFYILAFVALVLLIFILQLARVLGAVAT